MSFPYVDIVIWWLGVGVHLCLLAVLLVKKRWRHYPLFLLFVFHQNLVTPILFLAYKLQDHALYDHLFWLSEAVGFLLEMAVSAEIFATIWRDASPVRRVPWPILLRSVVFALLIASISAYGVRTVNLPSINLWEMRGAVFTSFLLCGCFTAISIQANALHLRRSRHAMVVGWGLTGIALLELSEDFRFFTQGWHWGSNTSDQVEEILYAAIVLFWTVGMWRADIIRSPVPRPIRINKVVVG